MKKFLTYFVAIIATLSLNGCAKPYGSYTECLRYNSYDACQWFYRSGYYGGNSVGNKPVSQSYGQTQIISTRSLSYSELEKIKFSSRDCKEIDYHVNTMEEQLRRKGLSNANPEDLNEDDRMYNSTARINIWSLRIGCSNPDRYVK